MGVKDAAATYPTSPASSANTDHASDKPLMLVALSATEAVGWEDLEAKVSSYFSADNLGLTIRRSQGRELTEHLSRAVSRLRKPLTAAATSTPSPPATRHGR
jgi:hypothetical protein